MYLSTGQTRSIPNTFLLYLYSKKILGMDLVCPVERYKSTSKRRLEIVCFYESALGQAICSRRKTSIEPLTEHIKSVFRIDPLPVRGFHAVSAIVLLSVLLYRIMVCYNRKTNTINPKSIKYMLGTYRCPGNKNEDRCCGIVTKPQLTLHCDNISS